MIRHRLGVKLSGSWGGAQGRGVQDGMRVARGGGELWSPSQPEMETMGTVRFGTDRGVAESGNQGPGG